MDARDVLSGLDPLSPHGLSMEEAILEPFDKTIVRVITVCVPNPTISPNLGGCIFRVSNKIPLTPTVARLIKNGRLFLQTPPMTVLEERSLVWALGPRD